MCRYFPLIHTKAGWTQGKCLVHMIMYAYPVFAYILVDLLNDSNDRILALVL